MLIGDKNGLSDEVKDDFKESGLIHLLAVSGVKTLKLDIPLVPETRINWAFVPLHIAIIYILKLCLDEEIIPRCRFPCSRGYLTKCINWQKK
jgi:competence protein ComEC